MISNPLVSSSSLVFICLYSRSPLPLAVYASFYSNIHFEIVVNSKAYEIGPKDKKHMFANKRLLQNKKRCL